MFTTSSDTSIWYSQGDVSGLQAGQKWRSCQILSRIIWKQQLYQWKKSVQLRESRNGERCRELHFQDSSVVLGYPGHGDREFELQTDEMIYYTNFMAGWGKHTICTSILFHGLKKSLFPWEQILFSHLLWSWISLHWLKIWPCVFKL